MQKTKRFSAILLALVMLAVFMPVLPAATAAVSGDWEYTVRNGEAVIVFYLGEESHINIPDTLGGFPVGIIGKDSFRWCRSMVSVTIPNSVTRIEDYAFYECDALAEVAIPASVVFIGADAFSWSDALTEVTFGSGVTSIGDWAFWNCASLTSVHIPAGVTSIGLGAFSMCQSLTEITVSGNNSEYTSIDGVLFSKDKKTLIRYPGGRTGNYAIPEGVTSIGENAFWGSQFLTGVTIPDSVVQIGKEAFSYCDALTEITLPESVTTVGEKAFFQCSALNEIRIPASVTQIGNWAFDGCSKLTVISESGAYAAAYAESDGLTLRTSARANTADSGMNCGAEPLRSQTSAAVNISQEAVTNAEPVDGYVLESEHFIWTCGTQYLTGNISPENFARFLAKMDAAYDAMYDLTGYAPENGEKIIIHYLEPDDWAEARGGGGTIGVSPWSIAHLLTTSMEIGNLHRTWLHELGHNFDWDAASQWVFSGEMSAHMKMYYVLDVLDLSAVNDYGILLTGGEHIDYEYDVIMERYRNGAKDDYDYDFHVCLWKYFKDTDWEPLKKAYHSYWEVSDSYIISDATRGNNENDVRMWDFMARVSQGGDSPYDDYFYDGLHQGIRNVYSDKLVPRMKILIEEFEGSDFTDVTLPDTVLVLDEYCFARCKSMTEFTIPRQVKKLRNGVFVGCESLTDVYILSPDVVLPKSSIWEDSGDSFHMADYLVIHGYPGSTAEQYAKAYGFKFEPLAYSVSFDPNGGSGSTRKQDMYLDYNTELRSNSFFREGYTFAGWNTKPDGSGTGYADTKMVKNLASVGNSFTLYAQWKANTFTVSFLAGTGTGQWDALTKKDGSTVTITKAVTKAFTRKGYVFAHFLGSDGKPYKSGAKVTVTSDFTLTAEYTKVSVGKGATPRLTKESGQIRVRYDRVSGAAGYQFVVSTSKTFASGKGGTKTYAGYKKNYIPTCAGRKLSAGTTYYVKIRAYKLDSTGAKVWGAYSAVKSIKF